MSPLFLLLLLTGACFAEEAAEGKTPSPVCLEPVDMGPCDGVFPMFFYNTTSEDCESFNYGGCEGNGNRFDTVEECQATCMQTGQGLVASNEQVVLMENLDSSAVACSNATCYMECADGFEVDERGCQVCRCRLATVAPDTKACPLIECPPCPGDRYVLDANGCKTCTCAQLEVEPVACPPPCKLYCEHGKEKDANGCELCSCKDIPEAKDNPEAKEDNEDNPEDNPEDKEDRPGAGCSPLVACDISCPGGQQKDSQGCEICKCIDAVVDDNDDNDERDDDDARTPVAATCSPLGVSCTMACQFGFTKGADGCRQCQCQKNPCEEFSCESTETCTGEENAEGDYIARCVALPVVLPLRCNEKSDVGPCKGLKERFFYNVTSGTCQVFTYGGCGGNDNRFDDVTQCQNTCRAGVCSAVECRLECPDGFEVDQSGCKVCRCKVPSPTTPFPCPMFKCFACPESKYVIDANGCQTCDCVVPRQKVQDNGTCPDLSVTCLINCPNGNEKDNNGCPMCRCVDDTVQPTTDCPIRPMCAMFCPKGFEKDADGCPICRCADNPVPVQPTTNCSYLPNCAKACPNGYVMDADGCNTCKCLCPVGPSCNMECPLGFEKNADGCDICKCLAGSCEELQCTEEETCITETNDKGLPVAKCSPGKRWCSRAMCMMFCEHGFTHDKTGCPVCSCLDHHLDRCKDIGWCKTPCQFGHQRDEHGCRTCECLPNPCEEHICKQGEVCESIHFVGCRNCPSKANCIALSDVKRIYIAFRYEHGFVRTLDVESFANHVREMVSGLLNVNVSSIQNVTVTPLTRIKTKVAFHVVCSKRDLVIAAKSLLSIISGDQPLVTFDLNRVSFAPEPESASVMYYSSEQVAGEDDGEEEAMAQASHDDKVIIASCLVGFAFLAFCAVVMFVLFRKSKKQQQYVKAPTSADESSTSSAKRV